MKIKNNFFQKAGTLLKQNPKKYVIIKVRLENKEENLRIEHII